MQKTKMGLTVGLVGAALYFFGLFSGYLLTAVLAAYILLTEDNAWLRKQAVKSVVLLVVFSLASTVVGLVPDLINLINSVFRVFGGRFSIDLVSNIINVLQWIISIGRTVLFLMLGIGALSQSSAPIPVVEDIVEKNM